MYVSFSPTDYFFLEKYTNWASFDESTTLLFTYYPPNPKFPKGLLLIQVSLPKVLHGNNITPVQNELEIEDAILRVNEFLMMIPWLPTVDVGEGLLYRIDLTYNHQVGDRVADYIQALSKLVYPRHSTLVYPPKEVLFKSGVASTKFYDKELECHMLSASGILRQETTLRTTPYIEKCMSGQIPILKNIKAERVREVLINNLRELRLNESIISNREFALEVLQARYGRNVGNRLIGHLLDRQTKTIKQMVVGGVGKRSVQRDDKRIENAGLSLAMTDAKVPLPPLRIELGV